MPDVARPPRRGKKLTESDVLAIRTTAPAWTTADLAARFGIARRTVTKILRGTTWPDGPWPEDPTPSRRTRRPPKPSQRPRWTAAEDAAILADPTARAVDLAARFGRTAGAVRARRHALKAAGRVAGPRPRWTAREDALLRRHAHRTARALAAMLGRSVHAVQRRRYDLGMGPGRGRWTAVRPAPKAYVKRPWTAAEDARVLAKPPTPAAELASALGRSVLAIHQRRSRLRRKHGG